MRIRARASRSRRAPASRGRVANAWGATGWVALAALSTACSSPSLSDTRFTCSTDADCLGGRMCANIGAGPSCLDPADAPIRIGMTAPLQGPSRDLGIEMRRGILSMFERVNREGGVFGRPLELVCLNDNYDPALALANTKELLDIQVETPDPDEPDVRGPNSVFAFLGNVGTPTMLATAPLATKNRVVFFSPFTGSHQYLRDGTNSPYVYNYRAGYYQETEAMIDYMASYRQPRIISDPPADSYRRIIAFTQNDSYGDAGYTGLVNAYNHLGPLPQPDSSLPNPSIPRISYEREDVQSVEPGIQQARELLTGILGDGSMQQSVAVVMIDTYQPGNKFIRAIRDWINEDARRAAALDVVFMHVSFVGSDSLAEALTSPPETYADVTDPEGVRRRAYAEGVLVMQVVPYYLTQAPGVTDYRSDIRAFDAGSHSFTSLEGYIAARLFAEALERNGPSLSTESFRDTLDTRVVDLDIGIGTRLSFSSTRRQASDTVWGSMIGADGAFSVPFVWNPGGRITPN